MQLVLLALEAAIYPTLLAAVVVLLAQPRRLQLLSAYLAGGMVISIGLGLGALALLESSHQVRTSSSGLSWGADIVVGALALLVAAALAAHADDRLRRRRPAPPAGRESRSQRVLAGGSTPLAFATGLALNLPGAAYLIALKDIAAGDHPASVDVVLVVSFNLIMFLLAEIPLVGLLVAPERTGLLMDTLSSRLAANYRRIAIAVSASLGVFLIARGVAHS
jgi:hypothetical protein